MKLIVSVVFILLGSALSANEARSEAWSSMSTLAMEKVFARSEQTHKAAMDTMTRTMTLAKAVGLLEKSHLNSSLVAQVTSMVHKHRHNLRKQTTPKGYGGLDGAKTMLNNMIFEAYEKYDKEILKCKEGYAEKCDRMTVFRKTITNANEVSADAYGLILDSQKDIEMCDEVIPATKEELKKHNHKCALELYEMGERLKVILADIEVLALILNMTKCKGSSLSQFAMARCTDPCTKKSFVQFRNKGLQEKLNKLQSQLSQNLMSTTFADMFEGAKSFVGMDFLQTNSETSAVNSTELETHPPAPRTNVPGNPCTDKHKGAPSTNIKQQAKCSISASPQCPKLQERFMNIQAGIVDEKNELKANIQDLQTHCRKERTTLRGKIVSHEQLKAGSQTKLAKATERMNTAMGIAQTTADEHSQLERKLQKLMKECSTNYINYEGEICALKKIRGELYKMKGGDGSSAFFQDCEVSKWAPDSCDKPCGGGKQELTRTIMNPAVGGAKCLHLKYKQSCNQAPCSVDCVLGSWEQWSECSAECGGGVESRDRKIVTAPKHGGDPCGSNSETRVCHTESCSADCELAQKWTKWDECSKDCDGGTRKKVKFVVMKARGNGKCPGSWSPQRLLYKKCNNHPCKVLKDQVPACNKSLDVVLLLDGSGSMHSWGFKAEKKAALNILDSFDKSSEGNPEGKSKANVAIILYSGPFYWSGVVGCFWFNHGCRVDRISLFERDMKKLKKLVEKLSFPQGSTLTSKALMDADAMLMNGRKDSQSVVIVITDGKPLSNWNTDLASWKIRKKARLVWIPVTTWAPLDKIKNWASRRWQENVIQVSYRGDLAKPEVITALMADICPDPEWMPWNSPGQMNA
jgi:uncharacterized protein YegL